MSETDIFEPPKSDLKNNELIPKAGWVAIILAIVLTLLNVANSFFLALAGLGSLSNSYQFGKAFGAAISPIIFGLIVVAIFQIGKRFRNGKSRLTIYNWTQLVLVLSAITQVLKAVSGS